MGNIIDSFEYVNRLRRTEFKGNDNLFTTVDLNREFKHIKDNNEIVEKMYELHGLTITKSGDNFYLSGYAFGFSLDNEPIVTDGTSGTINDGNFIVFNCREYENPIRFEDDNTEYTGAKIIGLDSVYTTVTRPSAEGSLYVQADVTEVDGVYSYGVKSLGQKLEIILNTLTALNNEITILKSREKLPIGTIMPLIPYNNDGTLDVTDIKLNDSYKQMLVENGGNWALCDGQIHISQDNKNYVTPDLSSSPLVGSAYYDIDHSRAAFTAPNTHFQFGGAFCTLQADFAHEAKSDDSASSGHVVRDLVIKAKYLDSGNYSTLIDTNTPNSVPANPNAGQPNEINIYSRVTSIPSTFAWYIIKVR